MRVGQGSSGILVAGEGLRGGAAEARRRPYPPTPVRLQLQAVSQPLLLGWGSLSGWQALGEGDVGATSHVRRRACCWAGKLPRDEGRGSGTAQGAPNSPLHSDSRP